MTAEQFDRFIESYKEFLEQITDLRRLGVDLTSENKKYPVEATVDNLFTAALEMMFTEQQIDLINDRLYRGIDIEFEEIQPTVDIEFKDWIYTCTDGCCTDYGTNTFLNGVELDIVSEDLEIVTEKIFTELGYKVTTNRTYHGD
jgi:hypothetical protein